MEKIRLMSLVLVMVLENVFKTQKKFSFTQF